MRHRQFLQATAVASLSAGLRSQRPLPSCGSWQVPAWVGRWFVLIHLGFGVAHGLLLRRLDVLANISPAADEFEGTPIAAPYIAFLVSSHTTGMHQVRRSAFWRFEDTQIWYQQEFSHSLGRKRTLMA